LLFQRNVLLAIAEITLALFNSCRFYPIADRRTCSPFVTMGMPFSFFSPSLDTGALPVRSLADVIRIWMLAFQCRDNLRREIASSVVPAAHAPE